MELTVTASALMLSIGLGLAGTYGMMSMMLSLMTRSLVRVEERPGTARHFSDVRPASRASRG